MSNEGKESIVIHGLDLIDIITFISKKNRRYAAMTLQEIEDSLGKSHKDFPNIRKAVLDGYNNYTRSIVRAVFKVDIEDIPYVE